jgi:hypothetical protein
MESGALTCPYCRRAFEATVLRPSPPRVVVPELGAAGPDGAVACAVHDGNAAVATCGRCGVFACALCTVEADGKVLCAACFDRLCQEGALPSTITHQRHWEGLAAVSVVLCFVGCGFLAPALGPAGIYYSVKGLRAKRDQGETDGVRWLNAWLVLGCLVTVGGLALIGWMITVSLP